MAGICRGDDAHGCRTLSAVLDVAFPQTGRSAVSGRRGGSLIDGKSGPAFSGQRSAGAVAALGRRVLSTSAAGSGGYYDFAPSECRPVPGQVRGLHVAFADRRSHASLKAVAFEIVAGQNFRGCGGDRDRTGTEGTQEPRLFDVLRLSGGR